MRLRNNRYLKSRDSKKAEAASRYRERHNKLESLYEKNRKRNLSKDKEKHASSFGIDDLMQLGSSGAGKLDDVAAASDLNPSSKQPAGSLSAQFMKNKQAAQLQQLQQNAKQTKYRETVRDREIRRQLKGQACFRCHQFY